VLAVARNTTREVVRERVVLVFALFAVALVGASQALSPLALGEGRKVVTDFGLAGASLLATLLSIFLGSTLLHKELERRTIYAVMAKPIRRREFLLGKFLGLWATIGFLAAGMVGIVAIQLLVAYRAGAAHLLGPAVLTLVELGIVTAFVVFFSSFTTPGLTALFTVAAFTAGQLAEDLLYFGTHGGSRILAAATEGVYWVLPHLTVFNARGLASHEIAVPPERLAFALAYGGLYIAALLIAAGAIFERREFR
jgi:ABC-type transport system involved in multi-copper enzyme maturation permease subunit